MVVVVVRSPLPWTIMRKLAGINAEANVPSVSTCLSLLPFQSMGTVRVSQHSHMQVTKEDMDELVETYTHENGQRHARLGVFWKKQRFQVKPSKKDLGFQNYATKSLAICSCALAPASTRWAQVRAGENLVNPPPPRQNMNEGHKVTVAEALASETTRQGGATSCVITLQFHGLSLRATERADWGKGVAEKP